MILSGLRLHRYSLPFKAPIALKDATLHRREGLLIELIAQDGLYRELYDPEWAKKRKEERDAKIEKLAQAAA